MIAALLLGACASIPGSVEAGISYATQQAPWPEGAACLNDEQPGMAKEVLLGRSRTIVVAGGDDPISDEDWADFDPGLFNTKNSDRHLEFSRSCFARSPDAPADCQGEGCAEIVTLGGHTWVALSAMEALDCVDPALDCDPQDVAPGQLTIAVTRKCHELVFEGEVVMLEGPSGEAAVLHATETGTPDLGVALPAGWALRAETLSEPLVLRPFGEGDDCYFNILRDERLQSYHQLAYAGDRYP